MAPAPDAGTAPHRGQAGAVETSGGWSPMGPDAAAGWSSWSDPYAEGWGPSTDPWSAAESGWDGSGWSGAGEWTEGGASWTTGSDQPADAGAGSRARGDDGVTAYWYGNSGY
jgi:hypothetical protein